MTERTLSGARPSRNRAGFTLFEVLLAMVIASTLLIALYLAFNVYVESTRTGRSVIQRAGVARQVIARLNADILSSLAPIDPKMVGKEGQTTATSLAVSDAGGTTPATGTTDPAAATAGTTDPAAATSGTTDPAAATAATTDPTTGQTVDLRVQFNLGVQGDETRLIIYAYKVGRDQILIDTDFPEEFNPEASGIMRIAYWLAGPAGAPKGLGRQVVKHITSEDTKNYPPNISDEETFVIAPEVRDVRFEYFNGTDWTTAWDGTTPGADGKTPIGPPMAIRIRLQISTTTPEEAARLAVSGEAEHVMSYLHVVAIPTANSLVPQQVQEDLDLQRQQQEEQLLQQQQQQQLQTTGGGGPTP